MYDFIDEKRKENTTWDEIIIEFNWMFKVNVTKSSAQSQYCVWKKQNGNSKK